MTPIGFPNVIIPLKEKHRKIDLKNNYDVISSNDVREYELRINSCTTVLNKSLFSI